MRTEADVAHRGRVKMMLLASYALSRVVAVGAVLALGQLYAWSDRIRLFGSLLLLVAVVGALLVAYRLKLNSQWVVSEKSYERIVPSYTGWIFFAVDAALLVATSSILVSGHSHLSIFPGAYLAKLVAAIFFICHLTLVIQRRNPAFVVKVLAAGAVALVCWAIADAVVPSAWRTEQALSVLATVFALSAFTLLAFKVRKQAHRHARLVNEF